MNRNTFVWIVLSLLITLQLNEFIKSFLVHFEHLLRWMCDCLWLNAVVVLFLDSVAAFRLTSRRKCVHRMTSSSEFPLVLGFKTDDKCRTVHLKIHLEMCCWSFQCCCYFSVVRVYHHFITIFHLIESSNIYSSIPSCFKSGTAKRLMPTHSEWNSRHGTTLWCTLSSFLEMWKTGECLLSE